MMTQPTYEVTLAFIKRAHAGQVDKAGKPYWLHPQAVAVRLGPEASDDERLIALLHDVLEDTDTTEADLLAMGYAPHVVEAVALLTRPQGPDRPTYMTWIRSLAASGNHLAIRVKIADNEENSSPDRIDQLPPEMRDIASRYRRSLAILRPALEALGPV